MSETVNVDLTKEILKVKETKGKSPERTVMAVLIRDTHEVYLLEWEIECLDLLN